MSALARSRCWLMVLLAVAVLVGRLVLGYHHHDDEHAAGAVDEDCAVCLIAAGSTGAIIEQNGVPLRQAVSAAAQRTAHERVRLLRWPLPPSRGPPGLG